MTLTEKIKSKALRYRDSISSSLAIGSMLSGIYVAGVLAWGAATLAVNAAYYAFQAGFEGIERLAGISETNLICRLKEKKTALGPNGRRTEYGIFETKDGKQITLLDSPVVTAGKFFPGELSDMHVGKTYDVKTFGWLAHSLIDAKESN